MSTRPPYTRREAKKMQPDILGRYHDLVMAYDVAGYERLLDGYPHITAEERTELVEDFKLVGELILKRRWRAPKSH
jgi:hypothetical protein